MAGKIQNEDIKSAAELTGAGGSISQLPNDTKVYVGANSINKTLNQAIIDGDIGGSTSGGTGKNYLPTGGRFTSSITGWSAFNTTFTAGVPGSITAGSTKLSVSQETTSPLSPAGSLKIDVTTISASAGHGVITDAMTIEDIDLAAVFQFIAFYKTVSGSAGIDMSGTSSQTFEFWVYNVGLASWYQPTGFRGMNTKDIVASVSGEFQTDVSNASNKNQYRFAIIIRNAPTSTCALLLDNCYFGRNTRVYGFAASDSKNITPTLTNLGFTAGTNTLEYWRWGDKLCGRGFITYSSGTGSASNFSVTLPESLVLDTTKLGSTNGTLSATGGWSWYDDAGSSGTLDDNFGPIAYDTTTTFGFRIPNTSNRFVTNVMTTNDTFSYWFCLPIQGWSANTQLSQDTDTRIVDLTLSGNPNNTITSSTSKMTWASSPVGKDTHAGWDQTNSQYVVPVNGDYLVSMQSEMAGTEANDNFVGLQVFNATTSTNLANFYSRVQNTTLSTNLVNGSTLLINLKAGERIEFRSLSTITSPTYANTLTGTTIAMSRISGPTAIASTETVAAKYFSTAGQSISSSTNTIIDFGTKEYDTHNAVTTGGSWKFTAPVSGTYRVIAKLIYASATFTAGLRTECDLFKNGSLFDLFDYQVNQATTTRLVYNHGVCDVKLIAGDFIHINGFHSEATSRSLATTATGISVSISRIGN